MSDARMRTLLPASPKEEPCSEWQRDALGSRSLYTVWANTAEVSCMQLMHFMRRTYGADIRACPLARHTCTRSPALPASYI
eukprot:3251480-Pleurochrysis_carterae.AAC.1